MVPVVLTPDAASQLPTLPRPVQQRMIRLFERLAHWPEVSGAKPLSGSLAGHYRLRTGGYRLQFHVADGQVIVTKLGHRDRFYEG